MGMHGTCWTGVEGSREAKRKQQRVKLRKSCAKLCQSTGHIREREHFRTQLTDFSNSTSESTIKWCFVH